MFRDVALEVSLKPFKQTDETDIRNTVRQIITQWMPLIKNRESVSYMLWASDGSELLDYSGNLDDEFQWACYIGTANKSMWSPEDPDDLSLHSKKRLYMENPPKMTYRILRQIVAILKDETRRAFPGVQVRVGETFDIGPEFAVSDFKYRRHPEICTGEQLDSLGFLNSYGVLNGDDHCYAGYPNGIPDQTPFGSFLGRQANIFLRDMDFDFLWLSNGVGFSASPWKSSGVIFDGKQYHTELLPTIRQQVLDFWKLFRAECPDFLIETRGTNFSAGIDYSAAAVCLYDIYHADLNILPPPNSPWAALDGNFGLELMGHMTRISQVPNRDYLFRFYIHDPWWVNSPWYDRYNGQPHDIYLPMAISRIDETGNISLPSHLSLLSIDNSFGNLPDACANEPIPHLLKAEKDSPDAPSPFVWVYPLREYTTATDEITLQRMMSEDWFMCQMLNNGIPVCTVTDTDSFIGHDPKIYTQSILITPVPQADSAFESAILDYASSGRKVVFYGSADTAGKAFLDFFRLSFGKSYTGPVELPTNLFPDIHRDGNYPTALNFQEDVSAGGLNTVTELPDAVRFDDLALSAEVQNALWFRAPVGGSKPQDSRHIQPDSGREWIRGEVLLRKLLEIYGYQIRFVKPNGDCATPVLTLHRSDNAHILSVYSPNTTVDTLLRFPLGAPVLLAYETELVNGMASYRFSRAVHAECRIFVEQDSGILSAVEYPPVSGHYRRRILLSGLKNATVRFFGENDCSDNLHAVFEPFSDSWGYCKTCPLTLVRSEEYGIYFEAQNITGVLGFEMPFPGKISEGIQKE